jgi:hypothetical protein
MDSGNRVEDIMLRHRGGERVKAGFYLNAETWEVNTLSGRAGGVLPGAAADRYLRIPTLGVLVFAPLMGALYAIFLPFIGLAMVAQHLTKKAAAGSRDLAHSVMQTVTPAWRPGEAYFTGEPGKDKAAGKPAAQPDERLKKIEDEIERREQGPRS